MEDHLDLLGLDAVRAGDATPEQRAHAEQCAQCRATIDGFRGLAARLSPAPFAVPAERTRDILALARPAPRRSFGEGGRRLWRPVAAAAAAAIILGIGVWFATRPPHRLDIVDAYSVAVRLREGRSVEPQWDLNRDGRVDGQDVDEIIRRSVAIR